MVRRTFGHYASLRPLSAKQIERKRLSEEKAKELFRLVRLAYRAPKGTLPFFDDHAYFPGVARRAFVIAHFGDSKLRTINRNVPILHEGGVVRDGLRQFIRRNPQRVNDFYNTVKEARTTFFGVKDRIFKWGDHLESAGLLREEVQREKIRLSTEAGAIFASLDIVYRELRKELNLD